MKSQKPITLGSKSQDNSAQFRELIVADCRHGRCVERASSIDDTLLQQRPNEVMYGREIFSMTGVNDSMFGFLARLSLDHLRFFRYELSRTKPTMERQWISSRRRLAFEQKVLCSNRVFGDAHQAAEWPRRFSIGAATLRFAAGQNATRGTRKHQHSSQIGRGPKRSDRKSMSTRVLAAR